MKHVTEAWEKRDWGGGMPTWRRVNAVWNRLRRRVGPARHATRTASGRRTKRSGPEAIASSPTNPAVRGIVMEKGNG